MYELHESVVAVRDLSEKVPKGTGGAVVFIYTEPSLAYEVEFVDDEGYTLALLTLKGEDISKLPKIGLWRH